MTVMIWNLDVIQMIRYNNNLHQNNVKKYESLKVVELKKLCKESVYVVLGSKRRTIQNENVDKYLYKQHVMVMKWIRSLQINGAIIERVRVRRTLCYITVSQTGTNFILTKEPPNLSNIFWNGHMQWKSKIDWNVSIYLTSLSDSVDWYMISAEML